MGQACLICVLDTGKCAQVWEHTTFITLPLPTYSNNLTPQRKGQDKGLQALLLKRHLHDTTKNTSSFKAKITDASPNQQETYTTEIKTKNLYY